MLNVHRIFVYKRSTHEMMRYPSLRSNWRNSMHSVSMFQVTFADAMIFETTFLLLWVECRGGGASACLV
jgi:hypothetical protein